MDYKIYFDMDGVLVDFNGGVRKMCGIEPQEQGAKYRLKSKDDAMWDAIKKSGSFLCKA